MPLTCALPKTWLLLQCSCLIFLSHHSATFATVWHECCTPHVPWLSLQAVSLFSVTRDIRSCEDSAYLALFPLHCNPEFMNMSPFPLALTAVHLKKQDTEGHKSLSPSGLCCRLSMTSLQGDKLQGPLRWISSLPFPKLPILSWETQDCFWFWLWETSSYVPHTG